MRKGGIAPDVENISEDFRLLGLHIILEYIKKRAYGVDIDIVDIRNV